MENLFAILEKFAEIKDIELVTIKKSGEVGLPILKEKLDQAIQLFDEVEADYLETKKVPCTFIIFSLLKENLQTNIMSL